MKGLEFKVLKDKLTETPMVDSYIKTYLLGTKEDIRNYREKHEPEGLTEKKFMCKAFGMNALNSMIIAGTGSLSPILAIPFMADFTTRGVHYLRNNPDGEKWIEQPGIVGTFRKGYQTVKERISKRDFGDYAPHVDKVMTFLKKPLEMYENYKKEEAEVDAIIEKMEAEEKQEKLKKRKATKEKWKKKFSRNK